MKGIALGRPAEHRHPGHFIGQVTRDHRRGDRDVRQLLGCRIRARESFPRSPPERAPAVTDTSTCTKDGALAVYSPTCGCPRVRVYTLSGCDDSLECTKLDWDVRDNPPDWWRCGR